MRTGIPSTLCRGDLIERAHRGVRGIPVSLQKGNAVHVHVLMDECYPERVGRDVSQYGADDFAHSL
jgi:hypothetical protein